MLHSRQTFSRPHSLPQTLLVKLVGESSPRLLPKNAAHRNYMILFGHVLMNGVVGETSQSIVAAGEKHLDLIGCRDSLNAVKNVGGLVVR